MTPFTERARTRFCAVAILIASAFVTAGGAGATGNVRQADAVSLRLGFTAKAEYAFIYSGLQRGTFAKHGIDLKISEGIGSLLAMQRVAGGSDTFAYTGGVPFLIARTQGMPIKMIATFLQQDPGVILSRQSAPVRKLKDIEGKSIITVTGSNFAALWPTLVKAQDLDLSKIKVLNLGSAAYASAFLQKQGDVLPTFLTSDALVLQDLAKEKLVMLRMSATGWGIVSNGLLAQDKTLAENPDLARRMAAAMVESFIWARDNPRKAAGAVAPKLPGQNFPTIVQTWKVTTTLAHSGLTTKQPIGWAATQDWQRSLDILQRANLIDPRPVGDYFTNDYLPKKK